jgi:hypothetical protein
LVQVRAIPERDIAPFLEAKQDTSQAELARLGPLLNQATIEAEAALEVASAAMDQTDAAYEQFERHIISNHYDKYDSLLKVALEHSRPAVDTLRVKEEARDQLKARHSYLTSARYYFDGLPVGVTTAKTDADGEFSMRLRQGAKYALAATGSREVMGKTERYYWLVWVTLDRKKVTVMLSNDNLITSGAASSVVTAIE